MSKRGNALWIVVPGGSKPTSTVTLLDHTWTHIKTNHPELEPLFEEVKQSVVNPTAIYRSNTDPGDAVLFFNHNISNEEGQALSVPVSTSIGIVKTACYRNPNYSGTLLWKK